MTTRAIAAGRPVPCGPAAAIIDRVGHHPDRLAHGRGPGRLPGEPSPVRQSRVGPDPATTPFRDLNPYPYSVSKGKVRDAILRD
jgi:hypothetical protein